MTVWDGFVDLVLSVGFVAAVGLAWALGYAVGFTLVYGHG